MSPSLAEQLAELAPPPWNDKDHHEDWINAPPDDEEPPADESYSDEAGQDEDPQDEDGPATRFRARLVNGLEITRLPPPTPLIAGLLFSPSVACLYGPSGSGKSFLAVDLACAVATGRDWLGRPSHAGGGGVLFVAAEGVGGLGARVDAWCAHHGRTDIDRVAWLPTPVNLANYEAVDGLCEIVDDGNYDLVVFDTLARCTAGADENSAKDMGLVVGALDRIRDAADACVMVIHHSGMDLARGARGSTALLGAVDTELQVTGDGATISVRNTKQKDAELAPPAWAKLTPAGRSVVAVACSGVDAAPESVVAVLDCLAEIDDGTGVSPTTWLRASGAPERTFYRSRKYLVDTGQVSNVGTAQRPRYRCSTSGSNEDL